MNITGRNTSYLNSMNLKNAWWGNQSMILERKNGFIFPESIKIISKLAKENVPLPHNHFLTCEPQLENLAMVEGGLQILV